MYIETVPNRGSPPAILLRESYRDGKTVRKRTLLNLSHWPAEHVEGLRGVLKGGVVMPPGEQPFVIERSLPHGRSQPSWARRARSASTKSSVPRPRARPTPRAVDRSTSSWP